MSLWPERLDAISSLEPSAIYTIARQQQASGKIVFIDVEGTTNENLFAGLYAADIVLVPMQTTQDDVVSGLQLILNHLPLVEEEQKRKVPSLIVINQNDFVTGRAKAHEPLSEALRESGVAPGIATNRPPILLSVDGLRRHAPDNVAQDEKAIAEMEALLAKVFAIHKANLGGAFA